MREVLLSYEEGTPPLEQNLEHLVLEKIPKMLALATESSGALSLFFCDIEKMKELNQAYRGKKSPTDVLSWVYEEDESEVFFGNIWGEIALCVPVCQKQAEESGWSLEVELFRLLAHGIAHLAGFDHEQSEEEERQMLAEEIRLLREIGLDYVYRDD